MSTSCLHAQTCLPAVSNPGFEFGNITDWMIGAGSGSVTVVDNNANTGTYAANYVTTSDAWCYRDGIPVTANTNYHLTVKIKISTVGAEAYLWANSYNAAAVQSQSILITNSTSGYQTAEVFFTTGPSNTTCSIGIYQRSAGTIYVDDFCLSTCTTLSGYQVTATQATCTGDTPANDGKIQITSAGNAFSYGISRSPSYFGPNFSAATPISGTPIIQSNISNTSIDIYYTRLYAADGCYTDVSTTFYPVTCTSCNNVASTEICASVFKDYNYDGIKTTSEIHSLSGVTVRAYDESNVLAGTGTTDANGVYKFTGLITGKTYRIEYALPSGYSTTLKGSANGTTTQFIATGNVTQLGVNAPTDYCQTSMDIVAPCYVVGNVPADPALISFAATEIKYPAEPYVDGSVNNANQFNPKTLMTETTIATQAEVGTLGGVTFHKPSRTYIAAAFVREGSLTPGGLGAIYAIDEKNVANPYILTTIAGVGTYTDYTSVGKVGLGDLEMSDDMNTLYAINIAAQTFVKIPISGNPIVAGAITTVALPASPGGCTSFFPYALGKYNGKIYVGMTCGAGALAGYVYEYDGASTFTLKLTVPFDYARANINANYYGWRTLGTYIPNNHTFIDWNTYPSVANMTDYFLAQPEAKSQPWLIDIAFDNGNMILGIRSRVADIINNTYWVNGGDILRACTSNGTSWTLESNGSCGGVSTQPVPTLDPYTGRGNMADVNKGPGGGEYYWGDDGFEGEAVQGAILQIPGFSSVIATQVDAIGHLGQVGVMKISNTTGSTIAAGNIFNNSAQIGKANGLGNITANCYAAPIEIGNYVWIDTNKDGVQNSNEAPLAGVKVALYKDVAGTLTKIAETTTNPSGEYYFSSKHALGVTWTGTGADTTLLTNQAYIVVFGETQYTAGELTLGGLKYNLTQKDATTSTGNDQNDSDAAETSVAGTNYPTIALTTGAAGSVNHTLDVGFYGCPTITMPSGNQSICAGSAGTNITIQTNQNTASSIKFVKFTADQMVTASPTTTEAAAIYAGTAIGSTVTPSGGASPYTATYTWNSADFPNATNAPITYYVYAITAPDGGAGCRPTQEIQITINPLVSAGIATNPAPICQNGSGLTNVALFNQLASEMTGGIWSQTAGTSVGTALDAATGIFNPNGIANGTYTFRYTVAGIASCPNDTEDVTIIIQTCCPPKICLPVTVTKN